MAIRIASIICLPVFFMIALIGRLRKKGKLTKENFTILWGTTSLTNYKHWSRSLVFAGWKSTSAVGWLSHHSNHDDFNRVIFLHKVASDSSRLAKIKAEISNFIAFINFVISALLNANLVMHSCEGLIFHHYRMGLFHHRIEYILLKTAKIKVGVIPYGGDAHVYRRIRNPDWLAGLLSDYPESAKVQNKIANKVDFYVEKADIFLPGSALLDGFGRSDRISVNTLCIDTNLWSPKPKIQKNYLTVTHSPNHRDVKGTKFILEAISKLNEEGFKVELILIEGKSNEEVREQLQNSSDVHIDQLHSDSYGLSAIESMALGIPTISSFGGEMREFFDRWSFSKTCPIIYSKSDTLADTLRDLIIDRELRTRISEESRQYVLDFHSYNYFEKFFTEVLKSKKIISV
jgi:glycosyltransferase involved in cell wall biosynthesis